jgi:hypothetical protein
MTKASRGSAAFGDTSTKHNGYIFDMAISKNVMTRGIKTHSKQNEPVKLLYGSHNNHAGHWHGRQDLPRTSRTLLPPPEFPLHAVAQPSGRKQVPNRLPKIMYGHPGVSLMLSLFVRC